jgi:hypothetical protein
VISGFRREGRSALFLGIYAAKVDTFLLTFQQKLVAPILKGRAVQEECLTLE